MKVDGTMFKVENFLNYYWWGQGEGNFVADRKNFQDLLNQMQQKFCSPAWLALDLPKGLPSTCPQLTYADFDQ